jgi:hypothetical protein
MMQVPVPQQRVSSMVSFLGNGSMVANNAGSGLVRRGFSVDSKA